MTQARSLMARALAPLAHRLRRYLPQGQLTRGVLVLVFGTVVAQGIIILSSPLLTRLYDPADLGALSVFTAILSILLTITCLSYELAIPLPEDEVAAANVLSLSLLANTVMSILAAIALLLLGPFLVEAFDIPDVGPFIVLVAVAQSSGGIAIALHGWAIRTRRFVTLAGANVVQSGTLSAVQLGLGVLWSSVVGLIVADIAARIAAAITLAADATRSHAPSFASVSRRGVLDVARRYRRFPILSTPSSLINTLGLQAPTLLIVALYGADVGGQLFLAMRVAALPVTLLARSVSQVYTGESARLVRVDPGGLRPLFIRTTRSLARAGVGPTVLLAILAPFVFPIVFGDEWTEAGWYTTILAPMYLLTLATSPTGATLDVLERQDLHLFRETLRLILVGGAVLLAYEVSLPPTGAILVLSIAGCLTYLMYGVISWWAIKSADQGRRRPRVAS